MESFRKKQDTIITQLSEIQETKNIELGRLDTGQSFKKENIQIFQDDIEEQCEDIIKNFKQYSQIVCEQAIFAAKINCIRNTRIKPCFNYIENDKGYYSLVLKTLNQDEHPILLKILRIMGCTGISLGFTGLMIWSLVLLFSNQIIQGLCILAANILFSIGFLMLIKYLKYNNQSHCNYCIGLKGELDKKLKNIYKFKQYQDKQTD